MSNSVDEAIHDLTRLTDHAKDAGDYPEFFDGLHDRVRSTLTAQQQRIETLEAALRRVQPWFSTETHLGRHMRNIVDDALNDATRIAQETGQYDS